MSTPSSLTSRAWTSPEDLGAMTAALSRAWASPRRPLVPGTPGDLEWWTAMGGPGADWSSRVRLWELGGDVVGWGWFNPPGHLDWFVSSELDAAEETAVRDEILDWLFERARAARRAAGTEPKAAAATEPDDAAAATEPSAAAAAAATESSAAAATESSGAAAEPTAAANREIKLETWAGDGWTEAAFLQERGWTTNGSALSQHVQALDLDLDPPRVPDGYTLRSLRGPDDIAARVAVHRAAFAPSVMNEDRYRILAEQEHYAFDHDLVIEALDGSFAAFAICWLDPVGSVGEFEPVGTHPDHQRRGLGRVVMRAGLRMMREAGLRDAVVFSLQSNAASEALYRSAGFEIAAVHRPYSRTIEP
jgi:ribosomal protein S18 acetylase RimI-like enzyme